MQDGATLRTSKKDKVAKKCPTGVDCSSPGTITTTMKLEKGYFKFALESEEVYECPYTKNCKGSNATNGTSGDHNKPHRHKYCVP